MPKKPAIREELTMPPELLPAISNFDNTSKVNDALYEVELASYLDIDVPTASRRIFLKPVKAVVSKLGGFYAGFITSQIMVLARELTSTMRLMADNINTKVSLLPTIQPAELSPATTQTVINLLTNTKGRVLVMDCATPDLLNALEDAGIDAYGLAASLDLTRGTPEQDPLAQDPLAQDTRPLGYDLRHLSANEHLSTLPAGALAGVLLIGFVDQAPVARKLELLAGVLVACQPGAHVTIVTSISDAWRKQLSPVAQDLVDGRPFRPVTWELLLAEHGLVDISTSHVDADTAVVSGYLSTS